MWKPNSIIILFYIFEQSAKDDTALWVCQSSRKLYGWGTCKLERPWMRHDEPDIGLSCQLHMLLYIDCMLSTNLSLIVSLMFNNNH